MISTPFQDTITISVPFQDTIMISDDSISPLPPPMPPLCDLKLAMYRPNRVSTPRTSTPKAFINPPTPLFSTPSEPNRDPKSAHCPAMPLVNSSHHKTKPKSAHRPATPPVNSSHHKTKPKSAYRPATPPVNPTT